MTVGPRKVAYRDLAAHLRQQVEAGRYSDDAPLPTEEQLVDLFGISRSTVRRAMQDLVAEGSIYRVPGRGTFPRSDKERYLRNLGSVEDLMGLSIDTECELLAPLAPRADIDFAGRLKLDTDLVMSLRLLRFYGEAPMAITTVAVPPDVGQRLLARPEVTDTTSRTKMTVLGLLEGILPSPVVSADQSISAAAATRETSALLRCAPGDPVLRVDRLYHDEDQRPVELAVSFFNPAYYTYRVGLRRHRADME